MVILRLVGYALAIVAFASFVIDGAQSIAASEIVVTSLGAIWNNVQPGGVAIARAAFEHRAPALLWDPVVVTILGMPAFVVALGLALVLVSINTAIDLSLARVAWLALRRPMLPGAGVFR